MSNVTIMGGSISGLLTALLLAEDGHDVTVLERDAAAPPSGAQAAWDDWERKGVRQFHLGHYFLPAFRIELERELPEVVSELEAIGALRINLIDSIPEEFHGGRRDTDATYEVLTGRRPVVEAAIAHVAERHERISIRRGTPVVRIIVEPSGIDHIAGVVTDSGEEFRSDLLIDASGRLSPMVRLLNEAGSTPPVDDGEDSGFVYYGRSFKSADGSLPFAFGGPISVQDSVSVLTLVADHGHWFVGIVASGKDKPLRALSDEETWTRVVQSYPLVAHWVDGEPVTPVEVMGRIEDRIRHYVVDGKPVVTGVAAVGDAWSCTNPSVGRGSSVALLHAVQLRDQLREDPTADPVGWALSWNARTAEHIEPWYYDTIVPDRLRRLQIEAQAAGESFETDDPWWNFEEKVQAAAIGDGDLLRIVIDNGLMIKRKDQIMSDTALVDRVMSMDADVGEPPPGPNRAELIELITQ